MMFVRVVVRGCGRVMWMGCVGDFVSKLWAVRVRKGESVEGGKYGSIDDGGNVHDGGNVPIWIECTKGMRRFQANDNKKSVGRSGLEAGLRKIILAKRSEGRSGLRGEQRSGGCRTSQGSGNG